MAMDMPPPSPRTEKRRLTGAAEDLEALASPSKRGTPTSRSFFSAGLDVSRTPADVSWIREQAGTTPRALDRDFLEASPAAEVTGGGRIGGAGNTRGASNGAPGAATGYTTRGKMYNRRTWTKEENDQLQEGMAALGGPNAECGRNEWNAIARDFLKDSRTGTQCATHWKMVLKPALLKGVWSQEEDSHICDCVARGVTDWSEVASFLPKRRAKHCRERWTNHLDPSISKAEWSSAEEVQLLSAVEAHGTNWTHIARLLPGRSESTIQEHWNAVVFRNASSAGGVRRGRSRMADASATASGARGRVRASALPVETERHLSTGKNSGVVPTGVGGGQAEPAVILTERERALIDHAYKTGLTAAGVGGGTGGAVAPLAPVTLIGTTPKGSGEEPLALSMEEDDIFGPLTAALLKTGGSTSASCSPAKMPPPSPTISPLKLTKQLHPDYTAIGDQLGDGWGVDDDPALADLYRSLDNIGESLFNEDTFELSFDFDSVDKPSPSCGGGVTQSNPSKDWENLLTRQERENSPFRRAAAKAAANLEQRLSPAKRNVQKQRNLEEACARAAAAAAAAAQTAASETIPPVTAQAAGPRVKQGFLRRLFSADTKPGKQLRAPFFTVRGCLSEANAPPSPSPPPTLSLPARPTSPAGRRIGGENQAPRRVRQPLSIALFKHSSRCTGAGENGKDVVAPTLKHGKAKVKIPPPQAGAPLSAVPASRFN